MKATAGHPQICWLLIAATNRWKTRDGAGAGEVSDTIYGMYELFSEFVCVNSVV